MSDPRWTDETKTVVRDVLDGWILGPETVDAGADEILAALADAGLLVEPGSQAELDAAWRHNAKLHNDMRRRIQRVATNAAAEQRSLSWVADELTDILDDPQAWRGETAREVPDGH